MGSPSFGWERLNDVYYRNRELYTLTEWDICQPQQQQQQQQRTVAVSKSTRTIASYKSPLREDSSQIEIFTGSGSLITSIGWNHHANGRIQTILWTQQEELVVVVQSGYLRVYYDFEGNFNEVGIGYEASLVGVRSVKTIGRFVVLLLNDWKIIYIDLRDDDILIPNLFKDLALDLGDKLSFYSWDVIAESKTHGLFEVVISINGTVYLVNHQKVPQQRSMDGPFHSMVVSPNNDFIALYNLTVSKIFIVTANFNKVLMEFKTPEIRNREIKWCGSDAVVIALKESLRLYAPGGFIDFDLTDELITLETELNGLSVLTEQTLEYLSKVNNPTVDVFKIGSTSNASILLDAVDKLNKHSPKANENLKIIGSVTNLTNSINTCLDAALDEFDPYWQKKLLKAASFGKSELELKSFPKSEISKKFVDTCNKLRILNEIRSSDIGLYLTESDFNHLGIERILKLLIKRQKFHESFEISRFLQLPIDLVFIDWACCKIKYNPNMNEEELSQAIISKFQAVNNNSYISFERIANSAFQEGRINLAKILINFENLFSKQIPLLLKMDELDLALAKAIDSQDIDLIRKTLLILQRSQTLPIFFKMLNNFKNASSCFEYFERNNHELLKNYYNQADRLIEVANINLHNVYKGPTIDSVEEIKVLNEANDSYGLVFKGSNDHRLIGSQLKLSKLQAELTDSFNIEFSGLSIIQTLKKLLSLNQTSTINRVVKDFKISEKKLYSVKVNYYIEQSKFDELYEFILNHSKRPPIGYEMILEKLLNKGELKLGLKLLHRANLSYDENIEFLIKFKDYHSAIDQATYKKDIPTLQNLKSLVKTPRLQQIINESINKINMTPSGIFNTRL